MLSLSQHNFEAYKPPCIETNPWLVRDGRSRKTATRGGRTSPSLMSDNIMTGSTDQMNWTVQQSNPDSLSLLHNSGSLFRPPPIPFYGQQRAYAAGSGFYLPMPNYVQSGPQQFFPPSLLVEQHQRHSYSEEPLPTPAVSNKDQPYKVPRDGSLKHRLLRPPDIHIVEPPASVVANAPLSAPPHHSHQPRVPTYFAKGSVIQLANGTLKRVEDLRTEDFLQSAELSPDLRIDSSTVLRIEPSSKTALLGFSVGHNKVQVTVEAAMEHPFFVFNRGWSSCCPERSLKRYGLSCHKLSIGNVCISLTHKDSVKKPLGPRKRRSSAPS